LGAVVAASTGEEPARHVPAMIRKEFQTLPDGTRVRTIALRMILEREGRKVPVTINYSRPTEKFEWLLSHLAGMLLLIILACGLATAWLALKLSRAALKPLRETADVIAGIDERNLSRRINAERMPGELTAMAQRLNEMLARLEAVFRQRKQFLADAAHELRTPTAALLTTLEVSLRRPRDQAALIEAMNSGLADARRLRKLVEQLMEHARGEHVRAEQAMQQTDIAVLVRECVSVVAPLAREKGVQLRHEVPETLPFVTQHDRLRSVLLNLLSNAIEYNRPDGSIDVRCTHDGDGLTMTVTDTGRGISADQLEHVFEPFYRGGKRGSRGDDPSHLGLGLFLVRSHVDALQGRCEIESRVGEGTTIRVILPEQPDRARPAPPGRRLIDEAAAVKVST
jgi:signal transduction histidine kinase